MIMAAVKRRICRMCKKKFIPVYDRANTKQLVCSNKCCLKFYDTFKGRKTRTVARDVARMVGKRSMAEVKFEYDQIEDRRIKINAEYEVDEFQYKVSELRMYTPDWTVTTDSGKLIFLEYKGKLSQADRKKMKLIKLQYPDLDIRFIFQKPGNKIFKGSRTTYARWAVQHGFKWANNELPIEWIME